MPNRRRIPSYRLHKSTGQAVVRIEGKDHYLGKHGTAKSHAKYDRLIAEWLVVPTSSRTQATDRVPAGLITSINELVLDYWEFAKSYYVKNGEPTDQQAAIRAAMRPLIKLHGDTPVGEFGPLALKAVREEMIERDLCRSVINQNVGKIRRMFKWGVENELVPVGIYQALTTVAGLRKGRSRARESKPVKPVPEEIITKTLTEVPPIIRDMIRFQRLTGCRPGEVCLLRPCDIEHAGEVWCFRPSTHKTEHRGSERRIYIGPHAQSILQPYLVRAGTEFIFNPRESVSAEQSRKTETKTMKQKASRPRPSRRGSRYTVDSFRRAIARACKRLNIPVWSPNQLRHSFATEVRAKHGLEAAQTILGHRQADVTQIYAERDFEKARSIIQAIG